MLAHIVKYPCYLSGKRIGRTKKLFIVLLFKRLIEMIIYQVNEKRWCHSISDKGGQEKYRSHGTSFIKLSYNECMRKRYLKNKKEWDHPMALVAVVRAEWLHWFHHVSRSTCMSKVRSTCHVHFFVCDARQNLDVKDNSSFPPFFHNSSSNKTLLVSSCYSKCCWLACKLTFSCH